MRLVSLAPVSRPGAEKILAPCFVGGCERSGTTILGRLIGQHHAYGLVPYEGHAYGLVPYEAKFHSVSRSAPDAASAVVGLPDLLQERTSLEHFVESMHEHWFSYGTGSGRRGLERFVGRDTFEAALERFEAGYARDHWAAAGRLLQDLFSVVSPSDGAWVERSPPNIQSSGVLSRALPNARFIHIVRDGRDVASSLIEQRWGPDEFSAALRHWRLAIQRADRQAAPLGRGRLLIMLFEDLIGNTRERTFRRLLEFLRLDEDTQMRTFLEREMSIEKAHIGRWRDGPAPAEIKRREEAFRAEVEQLAEEPGMAARAVIDRWDPEFARTVGSSAAPQRV
jgi:Sulfotransferase family